MTAALKPQIVHESETQRQYVRLPFPARVDINGQEYTTKDLSSAGLTVQGIEGVYKRGQKLPLHLKLPFEAFSMEVPLAAEIQHYNVSKKLMGCRFSQLTPDQIVLLNHLLKSFMAGDIVSVDDLLNVSMRDNFVKARNQVAPVATSRSWLGRITGITLAIGLGAAAATLIATNVYASLFTIKTPDAFVNGPLINIKSPSNGMYHSLLTPDTSTVNRGDPVGSIAQGPEDGLPSLSPAMIESPCDCYIVDSFQQSPSSVAEGESLFSLIPLNASLWVEADMDPQQAARIGINSPVSILVSGSKVKFTGQVTDIRSESNSLTNGSEVEDHGLFKRQTKIQISTNQPMPADLVGRPAQVTFSVR